VGSGPAGLQAGVGTRPHIGHRLGPLPHVMPLDGSRAFQAGPCGSGSSLWFEPPPVMPRAFETRLPVVSRAGAVPVGGAYLWLPVSSGSASLAPPWVRLQPPPHRTQHADFPHYAFLLTSCQGLWDLSCWRCFSRRPVRRQYLCTAAVRGVQEIPRNRTSRRCRRIATFRSPPSNRKREQHFHSNDQKLQLKLRRQPLNHHAHPGTNPAHA